MSQNVVNKEVEVSEEEVDDLVKWLPNAVLLGNDRQIFNYKGFWCERYFLKSTLKSQRNFIAKDTDVIIGGLQKTGTTWLKSLLFSVVERVNHPVNQSLLLNHNPHALVHGLETHIYADQTDYLNLNLTHLGEPRLLSTHLPYALIPDSIRVSKAKIVYITRHPLDMLVSQYYFTLSIMKKKTTEEDDFIPPPIQDFFDDFCLGKYPFGPYFDHVVEFWKISIAQPEKVLFLKYEDLKSDPVKNLKRLAEFIGMPFSSKEETEGVITQIINLCSFKNLKELEVNKNGVVINDLLDKKSFFRNGQVGDWSNHFTPLMVEKMDIIMQHKFKGTGLSFNLLPQQL
ncbi:flavonol sulfotransferase-like [Silene latifolia]|uniref:flavonol sulfotransferase-like n=1 Tax=Silene latifolia TaxID=37657 RepID=UPI003D783E8B